MELSKEEKRRLKAEKRARSEQEFFQSTSVTYPDTITVMCVKFGPLYGREYVERLRNMVNRHLTIPHKIVCLTDDRHPIDGVETIYQPNANYKKGWWHKVHMFDPNLPLAGRILYFDLDIVLHDNLNKLVANQHDQFLGIRDFNRKFHPGWNYLNSSTMSWIHGTQTRVWDEYKKDVFSAQRLQGDQDWIWKIAKSDIKFWPEEWIQSYKWEVRSKNELEVKNGSRNFKTVNNSVKPRDGCCVTVFHGDPKPCDVQDKFVIDNWC